MARIRKTEPEVQVSAASAAPARRTAAVTPRKPRTSVTKAAGKAPAQAVAAVAVEAPIEVVAVAVVETILYTPNNDEIAALAYSYWVARDYQDGCPQTDWLRAEQELRQREP